MCGRAPVPHPSEPAVTGIRRAAGPRPRHRVPLDADRGPVGLRSAHLANQSASYPGEPRTRYSTGRTDPRLSSPTGKAGGTAGRPRGARCVRRVDAQGRSTSWHHAQLHPQGIECAPGRRGSCPQRSSDRLPARSLEGLEIVEFLSLQSGTQRPQRPSAPGSGRRLTGAPSRPIRPEDRRALAPHREASGRKRDRTASTSRSQRPPIHAQTVDCSEVRPLGPVLNPRDRIRRPHRTTVVVGVCAGGRQPGSRASRPAARPCSTGAPDPLPVARGGSGCGRGPRAPAHRLEEDRPGGHGLDHLVATVDTQLAVGVEQVVLDSAHAQTER